MSKLEWNAERPPPFRKLSHSLFTIVGFYCNSVHFFQLKISYCNSIIIKGHKIHLNGTPPQMTNDPIVSAPSTTIAIIREPRRIFERS